MKTFLLSLAAVAAPVAALQAETIVISRGEAKLARALDGRVAGEPVDCIDLSRVRGSRIIDRTAIVYESGSTLYVNRPRGGARSLDRWDVMVTRPFGNRLCSVDTVQLVDSASHALTGIVFLGDFVPYRKAKGGR
jgi:hypothetical protein